MEYNILPNNTITFTDQCPVCKIQSKPKMRRRCKSESSDVSPLSKRAPVIDNGKFIVLNSTSNIDYITGNNKSSTIINNLKNPAFKTNFASQLRTPDYLSNLCQLVPPGNTSNLNYHKQFSSKEACSTGPFFKSCLLKPNVFERLNQTNQGKPQFGNYTTKKSQSSRSASEYTTQSKIFNHHENNQIKVEKKDNDMYNRFCLDVDALRGTLKELKHSELQQHQFENYIRKSIQDSSHKYKEKYINSNQSKKEIVSASGKRIVATNDPSTNNKYTTPLKASTITDARNSARASMPVVFSYKIKNKHKTIDTDPLEKIISEGPPNRRLPAGSQTLDCGGDARRRRTRARSLTETRPVTLQRAEHNLETETCVHNEIFGLTKRTREASPIRKPDMLNIASQTSVDQADSSPKLAEITVPYLRPSILEKDEQNLLKIIKKDTEDSLHFTKHKNLVAQAISEKITKKFKNATTRESNANDIGPDEELECMGEVSDVDVSDSESVAGETESGPSLNPSNDHIVELGSDKILKGCPFTPSLFPNVPPSISFANHAEKKATMPQPVYKVLKWKLTNITPIVVRKTLVNSGFRVLRNSNDWMGTWGKHMKSPCFRTLRSHQKINHFPGTFQIGRKDRLWRNLHKCILKFGKREFGFIPRTYVLPQDLKILRQSWERYSEKEEKWIIKPPASARGAGIRVVQRWTQIPKRNPTIVQKYIARPLLINGSKFDLRLYVLVTSIHPLRIYLYPDGLARFASVQYSNDPSYLNDRYMHLTNYSINKLSETYKTNEDAKACNGHKWTISSLWKYFASNGINVTGLWRALADLVVRTMISGESSIQALSRINTASRYNCYELFGIDVLLDADLKPWLLEVNISPSLHSASPLDLHVKGPLVQALFNTALYKIPARLSDFDQDEILKLYNMKGPLCYDKKLYTTALSRQEKEKHLEFVSVDKRSVYLNTILENLMPDDVRHLIQAEDEFARCAPLERIFPTYTSHRYMEYFENPRYYNRLFDAWEHRYNKRRDEGISLLRKLCQDNIHLQVPVARSISKHRAGCRAPTRKRSRWTPMSPLRAPLIHRQLRTAPPYYRRKSPPCYRRKSPPLYNIEDVDQLYESEIEFE